MTRTILEGRRILVTGGSRGIGSSVVEVCSGQGAVVGFTHTGRSGDLPDGPGVNGYVCDTTDPGATRNVLRDLCGDGGKIDGLVINAGIYKRSSFSDLSREDWERTLDVNLTGAFNTVKEGLDFMDLGSIVMVSSQLAFRGSAHGLDYSASKAGILGLARSLAKDLAPDIRVNSVAPGYVDTDILAGDSKDKRQERISQVPLGRVADTKDIAWPVLFLLSDMSSYMTGATLDINGGLFIH